MTGQGQEVICLFPHPSDPAVERGGASGCGFFQALRDLGLNLRFSEEVIGLLSSRGGAVPRPDCGLRAVLVQQVFAHEGVLLPGQFLHGSP